MTTASVISHNTSHLIGIPYPSIQAAAEKIKSKKKKKKEPRVPVFSAHVPDEREVQEQIETQPIEDIEKTTASSSFFQFQAQPILPPTTQPTFTGDHYRKPTATPVGGPLTDPPTTLEFQVSTPPQPPKTVRTICRSSPQPADTKPSASTSGPLTPGRSGPIPKKSKRNGPPTPVTSDARAEHLLLAARKIGRERAGIVAGYVRDRQKELEMQKHKREREKTAEREQAEKERLQRIAERGAGGLSYYRRDVVEAGLESSPQTPRKDGSGLRSGGNASRSPAPPGPRVKTAPMSIEALAKGKGKAPQKPQMANGSASDASQQQQRHAAGAPAAQRTHANKMNSGSVILNERMSAYVPMPSFTTRFSTGKTVSIIPMAYGD
ncbi:hypothetical protein C0993_012769 [Termitomyces sp. T159_Od127]|nr:hypothetical protein C0993_012769 [Termitomyces sp. T159_Od127]